MASSSLRSQTQSKAYNIVIFGASGYTGQFVSEYLAKLTLVDDAQHPNIKWAVAGRSLTKLQETLNHVVAYVPGIEDKISNSVGIIIADVSDQTSLDKMCESASLVIDCAGPFDKYGEPVVKACIKGRAHYIDISGEPYYIERMVRQYHTAARQAGIFIISACGFDSVPVEVLLQYLEQKFNGDLNEVEGYLSFHSEKGYKINSGTYHSAIGGFLNQNKLGPLRRDIYKNYMPVPRSAFRLRPRGTMHFSKVTNKWCLPFMGTDRSIVNRSQRERFELEGTRPVQFNVYFGVGSLFQTLLLTVVGVFFALGVKIPFTRWFWRKFPGICTLGFVSDKGPTRQEVENTGFTYTLVGRGWRNKVNYPKEEHQSPPDRTVTVHLRAQDPGYIATSIAVVQCALAVINEPNRMPLPTGAYPPGFAFRKTGLIDSLEQAGYQFSVLHEGELKERKKAQ